MRRTRPQDDRAASRHRPRPVRGVRPSRCRGTVSPRQRARCPHLHRHGLPHGAAAGGEGHPGTARLRRRPRPLRTDRARPPLPPDRHRHRQGHRVPGPRIRAADADHRRAARLRPGLAASGTVRPPARDRRRPRASREARQRLARRIAAAARDPDPAMEQGRAAR